MTHYCRARLEYCLLALYNSLKTLINFSALFGLFKSDVRNYLMNSFLLKPNSCFTCASCWIIAQMFLVYIFPFYYAVCFCMWNLLYVLPSVGPQVLSSCLHSFLPGGPPTSMFSVENKANFDADFYSHRTKNTPAWQSILYLGQSVLWNS